MNSTVSDFIDITKLQLHDKIILETEEESWTLKVIGPAAAIVELTTTSRTLRLTKPVIGQIVEAFESDEFQLRHPLRIIKGWKMRIKFEDTDVVTAAVTTAVIEGASGWFYEVF